MAPRASVHECGPVTKEITELRLLTEVDRLYQNLDHTGTIPLDVEQGVKQNLQTAVAEISMPYAVTTTVHRVEYTTDAKGRPKRVITWLGKNAVAVALSGNEFHFSEAAHARVAVEVEEAKYAEENLKDDVAQVFISPKMSDFDAPVAIARAEHLADEDAVRVSVPGYDSDGNIVSRKMESLLVRDIPLQAWVAMLRDPNNIFGKAFVLGDERSALSVMELFAELELPAVNLPEGPVTLVAEAMRYMTDDISVRSVTEQLRKFRNDQRLYAEESYYKADEWYVFDLELAKSRKKEQATSEIRTFITSMQHEWSAAELEIIERHSLGNARYRISRELEAVLEKKKRLIIGRAAAVMTNNDQALKDINLTQQRQIILTENNIRFAQSQGMASEQIRLMQAEQNRQLSRTKIKVGGGCAGSVSDENSLENATRLDPSLSPEGMPDTVEDGKDTWQWKSGVCQVKSCPSPKPTEVGPCSVCKRCQAEFDRGHDPTKTAPKPKKAAKKSGKTALAKLVTFEEPPKDVSDDGATPAAPKKRHLSLVP